MIERTGVKYKGRPVTVLGPEIKVGDRVPDFTVVANNLSEVTWKQIFKNKPTLIAAVPSLDTGICDAETRRFNEEAGKRGDKVEVVTISVDMPFAQRRWCGAAGIQNVTTYSDHKYMSFGNVFGCHVKEIRFLQRAIFVVDAGGVVRYVEYLRDISIHPNYEKALAALDAMS